ncbi:MAG TPA: SusD/RagB family nutrient-binding outer membrane lipoprotein [Ferruginibacter sp.]|nr:SusD/RagB family nutrient-binding outer membrane lipoprotein [Ferruginibacter sp.]
MKKIPFFFLLLLTFTSCKKFLDVNTSPNNPPNVPVSTILPTTTIGLAFANSNDLNRATSALVQHIAGVANQTLAYDVYNLDGSFDNQWNGEIYGNTLNDLQIIIDQHGTTSPVYAGIAKLQMAYVYSIATDIWGEVPYSQAAQGTKFLFPRFDKQEDIYQGNAALGITSLFDLVKSGLLDLAKTPNAFTPGVDDLVYKGDLAKWARMGNTLLLKFAIHISNRNPTLATSTIASVIAGNNYINSNALDFEVPFSVTVGNQNAIYNFNNVNRPQDQMLSARLLALSRSLNDTIRLSKFFTKPLIPGGITGTPTFVAFDNGSAAAVPTLSIAVGQTQYYLRSKYGIHLTGAAEPLTSATPGGATPIRILTNAQVQFILAESALILGTPGVANTYYQAGITASMQKVGMTPVEIANYFATNPLVVTLAGTTEQQRQQIITQKYMSWIGNGIEAYNDYRRTGYPVLTLVNNPAGDNPNVIPTRLPYTITELSSNPNAPKPRPKTDVKLWFAK